MHGQRGDLGLLLNEVAPNLRRYILGDTDSEVAFYMFLTELSRVTDLHRRGTGVEEVVDALVKTVKRIRDIADTGSGEESSKLTFIATNGHTMAAIRSEKELFFSTYKTCCLDRDACPHLSPECEAPTETGFVNHLIISSEPLQGDNTWIELAEDEAIGVDWRMRLHHAKQGEKCHVHATSQPS